MKVRKQRTAEALRSYGALALILALLAVSIWTQQCRWYWLCRYADENHGRVERYSIGYSYTQDKDGSGSGSTEYAYRVVLPDGSTVGEEELYRTGKMNYWRK